jgi:hypothetical protein
VVALSSRKLAQATVAYHDKSKCTQSAPQNVESGRFICQGEGLYTACCNPDVKPGSGLPEPRCYADPRPGGAIFTCKQGDTGEWCCRE